MLSSISPLGERARASRWWVTTTAYVLGSLLGGLAAGSLAALLGSLLPAPWRASPAALVLAAALLLVGLVLDVGGALPSWRRQVDEAWLGRYRGWVYGLGFGAQLGFGVVTIVTSATTYAVVLLALLSGHLGVGLAMGGVFGLVRAVPSVLMARVRDRQALHRVFVSLESWGRPADVLARVALAVGAGVLAATAVTWL